VPNTRRALLAGLVALPLLVAACGNSDKIPGSILAKARPIGGQVRFHPPTPNRAVPSCAPGIGAREAAHVELFAADRVVLMPAGIGTQGPRRFFAGRVERARCYGDAVTLEPTGIVLVRRGKHLRLADLFRLWGLPLTRTRLGSFPAGADGVQVYVNGRHVQVDPRRVALTRHAQIVLEVGPPVPPHSSFTFPRGY